MNAPLPLNESERLKALREYQILDSQAEKVFDELAGLAAFICNVPMASITLVDENRQWFKSRIGLEASETPRNISFCGHTILGAEPLIVRDALADSRFARSPLVTQEPKIRFYAGFPLSTPEHCQIGALCAIDRKPRELTAEQKSAMTALASQVMVLMEFRRASAVLAEALTRVKTLEGLLPVCAWCKRIRDDAGQWQQAERYLGEIISTGLTHGICPDCLQRVKPAAPPPG